MWFVLYAVKLVTKQCKVTTTIINSYSAFLLMVAMHFFEVLNSYDFKKELKLLCKPAGERVNYLPV